MRRCELNTLGILQGGKLHSYLGDQPQHHMQGKGRLAAQKSSEVVECLAKDRIVLVLVSRCCHESAAPSAGLGQVSDPSVCASDMATGTPETSQCW